MLILLPVIVAQGCILSTLAKYNSEVGILINSHCIYPQDEGHTLSAFLIIKKVPGREFILFSAYFTDLPSVVNSSGISIKLIFSLGGTSTPNAISLSTRRADSHWTLQIRPLDSLVCAFEMRSYRGNAP